MEVFRTTFPIPAAMPRIGYENPVMLIGSCFTENIGSRLKTGKFPSLLNPFGIIFNPLSMANAMERIIENRLFKRDELLFFNDQWLSLEHHGSFSHHTAEKTLEAINASIHTAHTFLKKTDLIIITLGTAWVYTYRQSGQVAANCHKIPQKEFEKRLLEPEEITQSFGKVFHLLQKADLRPRICFTLSPVRHWRDGAVENQLSKSLLHVAIQKISQQNKNCSYFPAYELMMDDLRDYRFYEADMIHPNAQAIDYIWNKFRESWISEDARQLMSKVEKLVSSARHRPHHPESDAYRQFAKKQLEELQLLTEKNPWLDFNEEIAFFTLNSEKG